MPLSFARKPDSIALLSSAEMPFVVLSTDPKAAGVGLKLIISVNEQIHNISLVLSLSNYNTKKKYASAFVDVAVILQAWLDANYEYFDCEFPKQLSTSGVDVLARFYELSLLGAQNNEIIEHSFLVVRGQEISYDKEWLTRILDKKSFLTRATTLTASTYTPCVFSFFSDKTQSIKILASFKLIDGGVASHVIRSLQIDRGVTHFTIFISELRVFTKAHFSEVVFRLVNNSLSPISTRLTFTVDNSTQRNENTIFFANSVGGWHAVRCVGESNRNFEIDRNTFSTNGIAKVSSIDATEGGQINIGHYAAISEDPKKLQRFITHELIANAKQVYLVSDNEYFEIRITNDEFDFNSSTHDLASNTIKYSVIRKIKDLKFNPTAGYVEEGYVESGYFA